MDNDLRSLEEKLTDHKWRLDNLYYIRDRAGRKVRFKMNDTQRFVVDNLWYLNIITKARQLGMCLDPNTRVLTADMTWVKIGEIKVGTEIVSVDEYPPNDKTRRSRQMKKGIVEGVVRFKRETYKLTFDDGTSIICTGKHPWLATKASTEFKWLTIDGEEGGNKNKRKKNRLQVGDKIRRIARPWENEQSYEEGWIGGMLDGEGSMALKSRAGCNLSISQVDGPVWDRLVNYFNTNGYHYRVERDTRKSGTSSKLGNKPVNKIVLSRMDEIFRLLGKTRPSRFLKREWWTDRELPYIEGDKWATITSIEALGEREVVDLQTSEGTYIAEGLVSHNTTFFAIFYLDQVLFSENKIAGIIAHKQEDMKKIFRGKILFAYNNLDEEIKNLVGKPVIQSASEITFDNGGEIFVSLSTRGGTVNFLHISEFGYICRHDPLKAEEIVNGAINSVHAGQMISIESTAEGRCYDDQTEILTNNGWRFFKDLKQEQDSILTMNPIDQIAYYQKDWQYLEQDYSGDMYHFSNKKMDLLVTPNHKMYLSRQKGPWGFVNAVDTYNKNTDLNFKKSFIWKGKHQENFILPEYKHRTGNGIQTHPCKTIPMNDWLEYLGYFLSEGHVTFIKGNKRATLTQSPNNFWEQMYQSANKIAGYIGCKVVVSEKRKINIINAQLASYLRDYTQPKRIPREILELEVSQLRILFEAIYVGDGAQGRRQEAINHNKDFGKIFLGVEQETTNDLQELCLKLGYSCNAIKRNNSVEVSFSDKEQCQLKTYDYPIKKVTYNGKIYCVNLPKDHLLMVRRNGKTVWCGNSGYFYDFVQVAENKRKMGKKLTPLDFKSFFFPWYLDQSYTINGQEHYHLDQEDVDYFAKLEEITNVKLTHGQKVWYVKKKETLARQDITKLYTQFPSTIDEAFMASLEDAYYARLISRVYLEKRFGFFPPDPRAEVHVAWDLGMNDKTVLIFFQELGEEIRIVDHYANNNEGLEHYVRVLSDRGYKYGRMYLPHDAAVRDLSTGISREQFLWDLGVRNTMIAPKASVQDGIEKVRQIFHRCRFNETKTQSLMDSLQNYKKDKSKATGEAMNTPRHDQYSHDADAFRVLATAVGTYGLSGLSAGEVNIQSFTF